MYLPAVRTAFLCICLLVTGQQRSGSLTGKVTDEREALIVGATVTVTSSGGAQQTAITNAQGFYTFAALSPGKYIVRVFAKGFATLEQEVDVAPGERRNHDIQLKIVLEAESV